MSEEVAALRSINRHLFKKGDSAESLVARARSSGSKVDFPAIYRLLANDGFRLPPSSVTLLMHMFGDEIDERKLSSTLSMADAVGSTHESRGGEGADPADPLWARVSLALATGDESSWKQPLMLAKTKSDSDDMNFWLFSKDVLRPLLAKHKIVFATQELEALMKSASNKPGHVSIRKFEQNIDKLLISSKNIRNQYQLAAGDHGPSPSVKPILSQSSSYFSSKKPTFGGNSNSTKKVPPAPPSATAESGSSLLKNNQQASGESDSDDEEAFFKSLAAKAKSTKGVQPGGGSGYGGYGAGSALKSSLKPSQSDLYGSLRNNASANTGRKSVTISPHLNVKTIPANSAQHKQDQDDHDDEEDDEEGSGSGSGSEDESYSEESEEENEGSAAAKPEANKKPVQAAKAAAPSATTFDESQSRTSSTEESISDMFSSMFGFAPTSSSSSSSTPSSPFQLSFPFVAEEKKTSTSSSPPPPPPSSSQSSSTALAINAPTSQRQSFLGLFMDFDDIKEKVESELLSQEARKSKMEGRGSSGGSGVKVSSSSRSAEEGESVNPLAMMFSAFESAGVIPNVLQSNNQNLNNRRTSNTTTTTTAASGNKQGNLTNKLINKQVARERTAKEVAAEAAAEQLKEEARAEIAARVAAETKLKLLEAARAKQDLEDARLKAQEAELLAQSAKEQAAQAAARTRMAERAAEDAKVYEEDHLLLHLQPEAQLSDEALRAIALGDALKHGKKTISGGIAAGGGLGGGMGLLNKEANDDDDFNEEDTKLPYHAKGKPRNSNQPQSVKKQGLGRKLDDAESSLGDSRSVKSGRSRVSRASSRASTSLGTAVSYSTAGSESDFGDGDEVNGKKIRKSKKQDTIGWSRTETRLLMSLVDAEARNAQNTLGGFMWDAVAASLRQRLREDPNTAARGKPQRRKGVDCRRRWDHVLKKAHATPKEKLSAEQKQWMVAYQAQKSMMGGGGMKSKRRTIGVIPEEQEVGVGLREAV